MELVRELHLNRHCVDFDGLDTGEVEQVLRLQGFRADLSEPKSEFEFECVKKLPCDEGTNLDTSVSAAAAAHARSANAGIELKEIAEIMRSGLQLSLQVSLKAIGPPLDIELPRGPWAQGATIERESTGQGPTAGRSRVETSEHPAKRDRLAVAG
ncbi:MAG TPA: hypothetical protein VN758_11465 [Solirubrobacterales bacterium]|nr:hypothetical protein [Solirubrobacterales bacterium]